MKQEPAAGEAAAIGGREELTGGVAGRRGGWRCEGEEWALESALGWRFGVSNIRWLLGLLECGKAPADLGTAPELSSITHAIAPLIHRSRPSISLCVLLRPLIPP